MQNPYSPPDSKIEAEVLQPASIALFFLVANSGVLTVPAVFLSLIYYSGGIGPAGLSFASVAGTLVISVGCSLIASLLILPFRKIRLHWAAIFGSVLSVIFSFASTALITYFYL